MDGFERGRGVNREKLSPYKNQGWESRYQKLLRVDSQKNEILNIIKEREEKYKLRKREQKESEKKRIKELKFNTIKNYFGDEPNFLQQIPNKSVIGLNDKIEEFMKEQKQ